MYATLLDSGIYLCSVPTMYRVLRSRGEVRERRRQATHPATVKPELVAQEPNRVWSWDITKLHGPEKWTYFYLYVVIDIFSRYVTGWMLARAENAHLAKVLISEAVDEAGDRRRSAVASHGPGIAYAQRSRSLFCSPTSASPSPSVDRT